MKYIHNIKKNVDKFNFYPYMGYLFLAIAICILIAIVFCGWAKTWLFLRVPAMSPPYADLRTVQGALSSIMDGFNPQVHNPGDPLRRTMNYPYVWVTIAKALKFNNEFCFMTAVSIYVLGYVGCGFKLLKQYPSIFMLLTLLSGASLLAVERGNNDLVVFCLLYLSICLPSLWLRMSLVIIATALKIYPAFSLLSLFGRWKQLIIGILIISAYIYINIDQIMLIKLATGPWPNLSYGSQSIWAYLKWNHGIDIHYILINAIFILFSLFIYIKIKNYKILALKNSSNNEDLFFLVGASIYLFTFLLLSNFDYRMIFLIFCIPYIYLIKNKIIKNISLIFIILASNQIIMVKIFGFFGFMVTFFSKIILFNILFILIIDFLLKNYFSNFFVKGKRLINNKIIFAHGS
jgi:hypothetical protein